MAAPTVQFNYIKFFRYYFTDKDFGLSDENLILKF